MVIIEKSFKQETVITTIITHAINKHEKITNKTTGLRQHITIIKLIIM